MIISNATPLIAFARIQQLTLLQKVVGHLVIPAAVAREIANYDSDQVGGIDLVGEPWIQVRSLQSTDLVPLLLLTLDQGEAEVIALALETHADVVLIDELTGRRVAESLNLPVTGSVGILIRAKQLGYIDKIKPDLNRMKQAGIYFSDRFLQEVLRTVDEI